MNRIIFEPEEIDAAGIVTLNDDARARHLLRVLHVQIGSQVKTGTLNGLMGHSEVVEIEGSRLRLRLRHDTPSPAPWCDLILAMPRPKVMKRLWAQLAALGVRRIFLVNAAKVEKFYFESDAVSPEVYRPLLIEGLQQAGVTHLPTVEVKPLFKPFVEDELETLFAGQPRLVAHPEREADATPSVQGLTPVLAVGPEGGWTPYEVEMLKAHGFLPYSLGPRILRTDTALIALLARLGACEK